mmetsp:Transcript_5937/g.7757  ORF Transcript_5937/g.7757 Transcript_5937/m.7757 type:complete len:462 (+) Transcript_5937:503-1888(+)
MSFTSTSISSYDGSYSSVDDDVIKSIPAISSTASNSIEESKRGLDKAKDNVNINGNSRASSPDGYRKGDILKIFNNSQSESVSTGLSSDDTGDGFEHEGFEDEPAQYFFEEHEDSNLNFSPEIQSRCDFEPKNSKNISGISVHKSALKTGLGLFSDRNVKKGELLFTEKPLVTHGFDVNNDCDTNNTNISSSSKPRFRSVFSALSNQLEELVNDLSESDKAAYFALSSSKGSKGDEKEKETAGQIFIDNFIPYNMNDVVGEHCQIGGAVFAVASRLNHSCIPNLQHSWDDVNEIELFFAARDIAKGEELTIAYVDPVRKREERQCDLLNLYSFKCNCEACEMSEEEQRASDVRRGRLCALDKQVYNAVDTGEYEHAVNLIDERMKVLKDEGLDTPKNLLRCEYDGYVACLNSGDVEGMHMYLRKACKHAGESFGEESLVACRLKMKVQELGFHAAVTNFML